MESLKLEELERRIGYSFQNKKLLQQAVTHSSFANEQKINKMNCYERIEFLGDAVLELVSSEFFYHTYKNMPEGEMTKLRASAVCEQALAIPARQLEVGSFLLLGKGEEATGGRERESIIADVVEAIIGAVYLDSGIEEAKKFIITFVLNDLENKKLFFDAKSVLQEMIQMNKSGELKYALVLEEGPDHDKKFVSEALINEVCFGRGSGKTKKLSEQQAAYEAILKLRQEK